MQRPEIIKGFKKYANRYRQPAIQEVVRETTAGGVPYRFSPSNGQLEFLMVQDSKDRWTIPKGHVEKGENTKQTALREIREETGLQDIKIKSWIGKHDFRFRRRNTLVLMVTHIYLAEAYKNTDSLVAEDWMNGIKWFPAKEAIDKVAYDNISKMMLIAMKRIRDAKS